VIVSPSENNRGGVMGKSLKAVGGWALLLCAVMAIGALGIISPRDASLILLGGAASAYAWARYS